jgi:crotonobetainyl-CoA:carnitine CoA-transferase CaiB-like acyl-CoA transferase
LAGGYQAVPARLHAATLGALWHAAHTEHGQVVDVGAMEAMATTLELSLSNYLYRHRPGAEPMPESPFLAGPPRRGNAQSAAIGLYPCADGYVGVHAMARQIPALLEMIGVEDASLGEDRLRRNDELSARIYAWAADMPKHEAYRLAGVHRAPLASSTTWWTWWSRTCACAVPCANRASGGRRPGLPTRAFRDIGDAVARFTPSLASTTRRSCVIAG